MKRNALVPSFLSSTSPGTPRRVRATPQEVGGQPTANPACSNAHCECLQNFTSSEHRVRSEVFTFSAIPPHILKGCAGTHRDDSENTSPFDLGTPAFSRPGFRRSFLGVRSPGNARCFLFLQAPAGRTQKPAIAMFYGSVCLFPPCCAVRAGLVSDLLDCAFQ